MEEVINFEPSEIQKFYAGSRIFITGGSGFLGHLLIQKLLRDCPDISKLYLLIRDKKGKTPEQRIEEMLTDPVFDRMKAEQPKFSEKIKLMIGDIEQPDLGLNEEDKTLIKDQVNVIFHLAATVTLDGKLKKAVLLNLRATKDLVEIAKSITNLKVFVHISTAYSHCYRSEINEQFYDVPMTPDKLLQITELLNDDELDLLTPTLIGDWPNTYSFTKALAENVIQEHGKGLPMAIVRPSMVLSTYKDPVEGWINNVYGPVGTSLGTVLGLIHVAHIVPDKACDMVPGDYVVNSIIAAAWHIGTTFNNHSKKNSEHNIVSDELKTISEPYIFNYICSRENTLTWGKYYKLGYANGIKWKNMFAVWHCFVILTQCDFAAKFYHVLLHKIPAHIADAILFIIGKKPRMVQIYKKIEDVENVTRYFVTREWKFGNDNTQTLWQHLNNTDRQLFPFSMKQLNWNDYFEYFGRGARLYILKDPLETLSQAEAKYQKFKIAHYCLVSIISLIMFSLVYKIFQMF